MRSIQKNLTLGPGGLGSTPCLLASKTFGKTEDGATWGLEIAAPGAAGLEMAALRATDASKWLLSEPQCLRMGFKFTSERIRGNPSVPPTRIRPLQTDWLCAFHAQDHPSRVRRYSKIYKL